MYNITAYRCAACYLASEFLLRLNYNTRKCMQQGEGEKKTLFFLPAAVRAAGRLLYSIGALLWNKKVWNKKDAL